MTDKLREKLCDDCGEPISICNALAMVKEAEKRHGADVVRAAIAAAPQPAPVDREALVEMLRPYVGAEMAHAIADALLARGLRLPGAPKGGNDAVSD